MTRVRSPQPDLFDVPALQIDLTPQQRTKVQELLQALLAEAITDPPRTCEAGGGKETDDDQDHA